MGNERGLILGVMVISAFVFSVAALAALTVAFGQSQQAKEFHEDRLSARYAAEAGVVWAMQRLWANPDYPDATCTPPCAPCLAPGIDATDTLPFDTNGDAVPDTDIEITVTNCGAKNTHEIKARAVYP